MERKQGVCATRRRRSKWETLSVTSYNIIMVKKRSLPLTHPPPPPPPPPYPLPPPLLPVPNKPYGSVDVSTMFTYLCFLSAPPTSNTVSALLTYIFCPPRLPPTLSQPDLLMFYVLPAYLQHCHSLLTYVFCRPRLPPTLSQSYLLMFYVGPAYLQHCLSPTYLCFMSAPLTSNTVLAPTSLCFLSVPLTSNTVSVLLTYVFCRSRFPPTLSQSYLLMFYVRPAYIQHCLSPTSLCFLSAPLTSTLSQSYLLMFSFGPAYLQHCLSPTYLCFLSSPHTSNSLSPTYLCFLSAPYTSNTVSLLLTYVFFLRPRLPPTLSQSYLLMFFVGPAYLQHCLSPTYLCFFLRPRLPPTLSRPYLLMFFPSAPLTSNTVSALLTYVFSFGPAYLQHCLSPTYLRFFPSAPLTSSRVSASVSSLDVDSLLPPCEWGGGREEEEGEGC